MTIQKYFIILLQMLAWQQHNTILHRYDCNIDIIIILKQ